MFFLINDGICINLLNEIVEGVYIDECKVIWIFVFIYLDIDILEGLIYKLNFGFDIWYNCCGEFRGSLMNDNCGGFVDVEIENEEMIGYMVENIVNYNKIFG